MKLREQARGTLADVSAASRQVATSANWNTVALVSVAAVSLLALVVGLVAVRAASAPR